MRSYGKKKSALLTTLRTLHSRAVTDSGDWIWRQSPYGLAEYFKQHPHAGDHNEEEIAEMQEDLRSVIAILEKYKRVGR